MTARCEKTRLNMRHKTQSEDASLEENSKWLRWLVFSVSSTVAKRGLSLDGAFFTAIDGGGCLSVGEVKRVVRCLLWGIADFSQGHKRPK